MRPSRTEVAKSKDSICPSRCSAKYFTKMQSAGFRESTLLQSRPPQSFACGTRFTPDINCKSQLRLTIRFSRRHDRNQNTNNQCGAVPLPAYGGDGSRNQRFSHFGG